MHEIGVGDEAPHYQDAAVGPDELRYHDIGVGGDEVVQKAPAAAAAAAGAAAAPTEPKNTPFDKLVLKYIPDNTKTKATQFLHLFRIDLMSFVRMRKMRLS